MGEGRYRHLSFEEREQIAVWRLEGVSQAEMARRLGRSSSTINRELARNRLPSGGYQPSFAEGSYLARRERLALLERDERLERFVVDRLAEGWSPEQIAARHGLLTMAASQMDRAASWRAMAQSRQRAWAAGARHGDDLFLHLSGAAEGRDALEAAAARQGSQRPTQTARNQEHDHGSPIPAGKVAIHDRPEVVQDREKLGDWEADLMFCRRTQPVLVLHERTSRLTLAAKLTGKSAAETAATLMAIFKRLAPELKSSITFDKPRQQASGSIPERTEARRPRRGSEFARHGLLASVSGMTTWFCDAYASWQKGSVENTNGRLRRQLPRHLDLDTLSQADLQEIVLSLNLTPRKCLGYTTPIQAFFKGLGKDIELRFA